MECLTFKILKNGNLQSSIICPIHIFPFVVPSLRDEIDLDIEIEYKNNTYTLSSVRSKK